MNHGERINLRLRPPGSPSTFYEYDQLVLVMLHEVGRVLIPARTHLTIAYAYRTRTA